MLPAVLGSIILSLPDIGGLPTDVLLMGMGGMLVAMVVGYLSLGLLMRILKKGGIQYFAPYCFAACAVTVMMILGIL